MNNRESSITNYSSDDLFQLYLRRQRDKVTNIINVSTIVELKQWAKDNFLVWYQGSKASFLHELTVSMAQRQAITGETFHG